MTHDADQTERSVLGLLLERHPAPVHMSEVERETCSAIVAADAVAALQRDGLAHVSDRLVTASRAAVRGDELRL